MSEELVKTGTTALATIPDYDADGLDQITSEDLVIPQLKICQAMSPEKDKATKVFIEKLTEGDLFRTGTKEIIGDRPVEFVVASWSKYGAVREKGTGKFIEAVAFNDPRTAFGPNGAKPTVDLTYEFYIIMPGFEPAFAVMRLDKTKIKAAKDVVNQFKPTGGVSKGLFKLTPIREVSTDGKPFYGFRIALVGKATPEQYFAAKALYALVQSGAAKVAEDTAQDGEVIDDTNIPF